MKKTAQFTVGPRGESTPAAYHSDDPLVVALGIGTR